MKCQNADDNSAHMYTCKLKRPYNWWQNAYNNTNAHINEFQGKDGRAIGDNNSDKQSWRQKTNIFHCPEPNG